ncbi:MAG TPA: di-heme oxidoredictase family protein [Gemmataceae bacterium]|nr:di-heme oxidoredictase family protein [Gemmataceae bacterium]
MHTAIARRRRWIGIGLLALLAFTIYFFFFFNGLPVIWGPTARASEIAAGRELFEHEWTPNDPLAHGDGLGPVFNARSCASCHFQGGLGGGGDVKHNATVFEVNSRPNDPNFHTGSVHNFSVDAASQESTGQLKTLFPMIKGRSFTVTGGDPHCPYTRTVTVPDFDPVQTHTVQPTALFGAGWVDLISDRAIIHNRQTRLIRATTGEFNRDFSAIPTGRIHTLADGRVGKFGWKAQFATLREFVAAACANELGLGTPDMEQAKPLCDPNRTAPPDLDKKQFRALVSFVKTLPKPVETLPSDPVQREAAVRGKEVFRSVGCAACHVPDMGGVKGVYSDFLLYSLENTGPAGGDSYGEPPPEHKLAPRPENEPKPSEWKTPALWGVADSAPYMHDGSASTLQIAIAQHRGDAKSVQEAYSRLPPADQAAVIAFLQSLKAPPDATQLQDPSITKIENEPLAAKKGR